MSNVSVGTVATEVIFLFVLDVDSSLTIPFQMALEGKLVHTREEL